MTDRRSQLAQGLQATTERIARACSAAGRPNDVTLVVVTKTFPVRDIELLADLGVQHVAENRAQEGQAKAEALADRGLTWHFIGQLQRNKAASVARWANVVESVDRAALLTPLARGIYEGAAGEGPLDVLVQVSLDDPPDRGGVAPAQLSELADLVAATEHLHLAGLMAIAPHPGDPAEAFARLADLRATLTARFPDATVLSAGMSGDLEIAIAHGATQVRVGGAILGNRPAVQ
jgi:pyridoxal phosphate enzyme (YggS family)